jgi:hypothetical protein
MAWREQKNHVDDCYFCMTKTAGYNKKNAKTIVYPNLPSAIRPIPYQEGEDGPVPSGQLLLLESEDEDSNTSEGDSSFVVMGDPASKINQGQLDHLVKKLKLSKKQAVLTGSMLKEYGVLDSNTKFSFYTERDLQFKEFFKQSDEHGFVYCCNIPGLFSKLGIRSDVEKEWWLFIDGSVTSVKAVLLHKENEFPAIPVGYSREAKESHETMKYLLDLLNYEEFQWNVGGDFKIIGLVTGLQSGYTKYCCFLCQWDSRARAQHYSKEAWPVRQNRAPGQANIKYDALVPPEKILLPALHIKLGLFKNFVKALKKDGAPMAVLRELFPKLSAAKLKEGVFVGPDTKKMMNSQRFTDSLNAVEKRAWLALKDVKANFLGKLELMQVPYKYSFKNPL